MKKVMALLLLLFVSPAFATVSDSETVRQSFACDGANEDYTFTFKCNSADDVLVYAPLTSTGLPTAALTVDVDYTIAATDSSYLNGGVVTITPALAATYTVQIVRSIKQSQETAPGAITPTSVVAALDKLTRAVRDLEDWKDRSFHIPDSDVSTFDMVIPNAVSRASTFPFFDSAGNLTCVAGVSESSVSTSSYGSSLIVAADAAAAATLLALGTTDNVTFAEGTFSGLVTFTSGILSNDDITLGAGDDLVGSATSDITWGDGSNKFTVAGATGNTLVAGTLTVTGASTFNSHINLGAGDDLVGSTTSDIAIGDSKFTVAGDTGNTVIAGTLGVTGNAAFTGFVDLGAVSELTISGGAVTATSSYHTIDTQDDDATDDLTTINGGAAGDILIVTPNNSDRDVTFKDATGNLRLAGSADFAPGDNTDTLMLVYSGTYWVEISRSNN